MNYIHGHGNTSKLTLKGQNQCQSRQTILCDPFYPYRHFNGNCNNLKHPTWGIAEGCYLRFRPAFYDGFDSFRQSKTGKPLPEPRDLILNIFTNVHRPTSKVSFMFTVYGQTIAHDISRADVHNISVPCCTPEFNDHPSCAAISVRPNDPFFSKFNQTCLFMHRTQSCAVCNATRKQQVNAVTSALDASMVYDTDDNRAMGLRTKDGTGKLISNITEYGELLTFADDPSEIFCPVLKDCFLCGDLRVNQHAYFSSILTLFMREHNRIASKLMKLNPHWKEDTLYQEARRINIATLQCITYKEYLPTLLGPYIMEKYNLAVNHDSDGTKYSPNIRFDVRNEFANAAFRLHSMVPSKTGALNLRFKNTYQNPELIVNGHLDKMMEGACKAPSEKYDHYYVTDTTDYMGKSPGKLFGTDLGSLDIQRGRDHGIAPYIVMVKFCSEGRIKISTFDDLAPLLMTKKRADLLKKNYEAVEDIDLWVGMQMEHIFPGSEVGLTAACIIAKQFYLSKFGDRFYFEHKDEAPSFTEAQRNTLKNCALSRLLCDNTNITQVQKNAMLLPGSENTEVPCEDIPQIDLSYWKQDV
ncbi:unnamed protein product [Larinioides sclopetarius]